MSADRLALLFPGQGCQYVGMGADLSAYPEAQQTFAQADDILGFFLSRMCQDGPAEMLNETSNTQPAVYVTSVALWRALAPRLEGLFPRVAFAAGHSLGEFTALTVAGALPFEQGVRLVFARGEAMREAGASAPGGMAALIGLEADAVAEVVAEAGGASAGVWVANDNAPGQVVIAGERAALARAMELAQARGAKRVLPLAVSVACHTPLMAAAAARLGEELARIPFQRPWAPVVSNVSAAPLEKPEEIKAALLKQLGSPVRWVESVRHMAAAGVAGMIEVGPKAVVSGLVKRIAPEMALYTVTNASEIAAFQIEA
jgi:[acyl-carrier-protein] S-malonyltransferase